MANWKALAEAHGWVEAHENGEPCLAHEELNRIWPLGDWEGACRDIGLDEGDAEYQSVAAEYDRYEIGA